MNDQLNNFLVHLSPVEPPSVLESRIIRGIRAAEQRRILFLNGVISVVWTLLLILCGLLAHSFFISELDRSDFLVVASTALDAGALLATYWKDALFALLESFPVMSAIMTLATLMVLAWALRSYRMVIRLFLREGMKKHYV